MSFFLDELKPLKLYKGKYFYPIDTKDRMRGGIVYLLTPNLQSSINIMNNPSSSVNTSLLKSYYLEKNVDFVINNIKDLKENNQMVVNEETMNFNSLLYYDLTANTPESISLTETELFSQENGEKFHSYFPYAIDDIFNEETIRTKFGTYNFSAIFRKMLYNQRIKSQKEVLIMYDKIKEQVPYIQYAYVNPHMYAGKNLFYDWSYYTESFFKHMPKGYDIGEKGIDLFSNFLKNYLNNNVFRTSLNYKRETIVIPVEDWVKDQDSLNFLKSINPISMMIRSLKNRQDIVKRIFDDKIVLFTSQYGFFILNTQYFKFSPDYNKFLAIINAIVYKDAKALQIEELTGDSKKSIVVQLANKLETDGKIKLSNLSGGTDNMSKEELKDMGLLDDPMNSNDIEVKKAALVDKLEKIADKSTDINDAEKELENPSNDDDSDWMKEVLIDLNSEDGDGVKMNAARTARMNQARKDILGKKINNKSIGDILKDFKKNDDIPETSIPIESIDEHWKHLKFPNFNKVYDMRPDIVAMFMHFQDVTHPMNIVSLDVENTSTSEDYKDTWTCVYEDAETGKRHTMKLDIPNLIGDRFMKLRGNEKVLIGQMMLLPITKTEDDTVQVVSNYNKIFIRRKSPSGLSKSTPIINKLVKALDKYNGKDIKVVPGDNRKICKKYELPMEFVDIASLYAKLNFKDGSYISFNMDDLVKIPFDTSYLEENDKKLPLDSLNKKYLGIYVKNGKRIPITGALDSHILEICREHDTSGEFDKLYSSASVAKRLMYSEASVLNTNIPVAVMLCYNIGMQKLLNKMEVKYEFSETRPSKGQTYIKFSDGYLIYENTTAAQNMMLNGLMECDFTNYSIKQINGKEMWLDILDDFGGRIKADGLDNFYDLMFDPITKEICNIMNIPDNFPDGMIYANNLLVDNKYIKHTDITGNRLRTNEVIVGHLYLILSRAFGAYRNMIKRSKGSASFTAKRSAVIDSILNHDQTSSDLSTLTPLLEAEAASKVTFKGLSGLNSDRAFSIDKRTYDKSMLGILGLSTGFAGTVGINRQMTIDAGVTNKRGFMSTRKPSELDNTRTFTVLEALSPMAVNHDDPIRTCMAFTQTVQHQMIVKRSMPNLVTTGCDEALPYLTSNKFAYKFSGQRGVVTEVTDDYIIIEDKDTGKYDYIDIRELIQKNSDGGFFVTTKLTPIVKKGDKLSYNQIVAYNKDCYSGAIGAKDKKESISYNIGTLAKVAIMDTDLGYEDSCVVDNTVSEALATEFVVQKEINLDRNSNVYNLVKIGQHIEEGEPLLIFQDAFDEKEANELLASLVKDKDVDMLSDLGRKQIHSKVTGTVQDIKIYRTCEIDVLSPTLQKICKEYDARINKLKNVMKKYKIDKEYTLESTGKLPMEGKLKATEGVKIEFYIKVYDKFGIGDKLVFAQALKGVNSYIIEKGEEAYTDFRPNEHINAFLTIDGVMARMVSSALAIGLTNKILIELSRQCQETLGIKWRPIHEILQNPE